ncbi:MAG: sugar ABC transporter permease [Oscillospiraceae bacterium]|nr:sugar ABC transporter permease [Oscillospiraceae bacterium]
MGKKQNRKNTIARNDGFLWILPAFIFLVAVVYYSIFYTFNLSTVEWNGLDPVRINVGLGNYERVFRDWIFYRTLRNTAVFFAVTFVVQNILGFLFAAILHTDVKIPTVYKCLVFIPTILPPATMAPVFRLLFSPQGMLQSIFSSLNLGITVDWLAKPASAMIILMAVTVWQYTGMSFILYFAAMSQIDKEMMEAARLDGIGNIGMLIRIVWPTCLGTTVSLAMLGVIGALKTFDIPYLITGGGPNRATEFLGTYIYRQGIRQSNLGYAAALSVILLVLAVGGALLMSRVNKKS